MNDFDNNDDRDRRRRRIARKHRDKQRHNRGPSEHLKRIKDPKPRKKKWDVTDEDVDDDLISDKDESLDSNGNYSWREDNGA